METTKQTIKKVTRDGKVAVLIYPGFGSGWYTCNTSHPELLFHPKLVAMVGAGKQSEINSEWIEKELNLVDIYCGGASDLEIQWLNEGAVFDVEEYDGSESIRTVESLTLRA